MKGTKNETVWYRSETLRETYEKILHPSGLEIYLFPKKHSTAYALLATKFGSLDTAFRLEGDGKDIEVPDGCAHFLEHKMFEKADGSDAFEVFSDLGADANAYTAWDKTAYLFSTTSHIRECIAELLEFVSHPHFTEASVKKEQGIIAEEIRMNDDAPQERCFMNLMKAMYRENHIRKEICGSEESIAKITPEVLYACCRVFYRPENMVLVVVGDVSEEDVLPEVDRVFPGRADRKALIRRDENAHEKAAVESPRIEEKMEVGKPLFLIGVKDFAAVSLSPSDRMRRDVAMSILKEMLFSTSGDLYTRLLDENLISPGFSAGYGATDRYAFLEIAGESYDPDRVLMEVRKTVEEAKQNGIDADALSRARRVLYAKAVKSFDTTQTIGEMLLDYVTAGNELFRSVDLLFEIQPEEISRVLNDCFPPEAFALSVISPLREPEI